MEMEKQPQDISTPYNDKETRFVDLVGLIKQAQHSGDEVAVHKLTKEGLRITSRISFHRRDIIRSANSKGSWEEANKTLADAERRKVKQENLVKKSRAVVLAALAQSKNA